MRTLAFLAAIAMVAACQPSDVARTSEAAQAVEPGSAPSAAVAAADTIRLRITGMTCATCPVAVRTALRRVPGVTAVEVSYERAEARVVTSGPVAPERLVEAVRRAGFGAEVLLRRSS